MKSMTQVGAIAAKSEKEKRYHLGTVRVDRPLGDGTAKAIAARKPRSTISGRDR